MKPPSNPNGLYMSLDRFALALFACDRSSKTISQITRCKNRRATSASSCRLVWPLAITSNFKQQPETKSVCQRLQQTTMRTSSHNFYRFMRNSIELRANKERAANKQTTSNTNNAIDRDVDDEISPVARTYKHTITKSY